MGMSASQMRYCMLTGRKSDVQFQGQQINQQRTTLATETSAYNSQLLDVKVPTAPSSSDYTTNNYSASINGTNVSLGQIDPEYDSTNNPTGAYTVHYTKTTTGIGGVASTTDNIYSKSRDAATGNEVYTAAIDNTKYTLARVTDQNTLNNLINGVPGLNGQTMYQYSYKDSQGNAVTKYVTQSDLDSFAADTDNKTSGIAIQSFLISSNAAITKSDSYKGVKISWSDSGRMQAMTIGSQTYTVSCSTTTNDHAYNDAMNEYEYQKSLYDQKINNINAQIDVIENEDKKLELKLKDLDTQNNALDTELDSVKKVIQKDVEQSFKTFA